MLGKVILALLGLKAFTKLSAGECASRRCLLGKTAIVTGSNCGVGYIVSAVLASKGCKVIMADSDPFNISHTQIVSKTHNENIISIPLDLTSFQSVRKFVEDVKKVTDKLDILVNHSHTTGKPNVETKDGFCEMLQVNYLSQFLLTHLLLDLLINTPRSRIVFVSSLLAFGHNVRGADYLYQKITPNNSLLTNIVMYNNTKVLTLAAAVEFAKRLSITDVTCNACHPGLMKISQFEDISLELAQTLGALISKGFGKTAREAAQTPLHCAMTKELDGISGKFYVDCRSFRLPVLARIQDFRHKLWELSEKIVVLEPEEKLHAKLEKHGLPKTKV